jgi:Uma2 family endonuclease
MITTSLTPPSSLEDWLQNPLPHTEWVDGELIEKNGMTLKHSKVQAKFAYLWKIHLESSGQGGEVYTDVPSRTRKQGRSPDVAYLTPELVAQYGNAKALPRSFPLCVEIVSPTDLAESVILKAQEYLQSGSEEVWLVYPESYWVIVLTSETKMIFASGEVVSTQKILLGFSITVDELLG